MKTVDKKNNKNINNKKQKENENTNINKNNKNIDNKFIKMLIEYKDFYKENLKRKQIIIYIISLILFFVSLIFLISNININDTVKQVVESGGKIESVSKIDSLISIFKEDIPITFFMLFAGITPYFYLPIFGLIASYNLASQIANMYVMSQGAFTISITALGMIIKLFGYSLAISMGIYYCKISTKKFKYSQRKGFSFIDLKKNYYEMKKMDEKLEKIEKKIKEKQDKVDSNNVKAPYKELIITFCISSIIVIIGTIFTII